MAAEIGDPTEDTETGAEITAKETWRHSITGTARYLVAGVVEVETGTTAEAAVCEGGMVQTPNPPTKTGRKLGAADRTFGKEVGWRRRNNGLGDGDKIFVRLCRRDAHSEASHRRSQDISEACHRSAHSEACHHVTHRISVKPAIAALTVRPAITALTMINLDY